MTKDKQQLESKGCERRGPKKLTPEMIERGAKALRLYFGEDGEPMSHYRRAVEAVLEAVGKL